MDDVCELEIPMNVELKESKCVNNELGVYCTVQLDADQFLGNYKGKIRKQMNQCADPDYVWTILSSRQVPLFYIDASDPKDSNWLRFIRSTNDITKYNTICMQQNQQINYFTYKKIMPGEELITYLPKKKVPIRNKGKRSTYSVISTIRYPPSDSSTTTKTNDIVKLSSIKLIENKFPKHRSNIAISSSPTKHQPAIELKMTSSNGGGVSGPNTRSKQKQQNNNQISLRKVKSDNVCDKIIIKNNNQMMKSAKKSKKIVNKKTEFKCNICSFKSTLWYDVKLHLYKTHINPKFMRINNKNRKIILKQINRKIISRKKKSSFIQTECKYVLDSIIDKIAGGSSVPSTPSTTNDYNKYCLYKCHYESCNQQYFVYKNQLKKHFKKLHQNSDDVEVLEDEDEDEDDDDELVDNDDNDDDDNIINNLSYSDSDYDTDNESNLEKKLVKSKILNENDDLIEFDDQLVDNQGDDEEMMVEVVDEVNDEEQEEEVDDDDDDDEFNELVEDYDNFNDFNEFEQPAPIMSIEEETRDCHHLSSSSSLLLVNKKISSTSAATTATVDDSTTINGEDTNSTPVGSLITSPNETNDDDVAKFTCNLCKKQFEDRQTLMKHQTKEFSLKMLKKKKDARKKKWRDIHWKRKIDMSYIETTQFNSISQNIADNLSFCIDGTIEDLKSYNKEVKDYLMTELGVETDLQMFLKCFPDLYEEFSDQLQSQFMDINLIRKANSYFAHCYYSPKEQQQQQQLQQQQKLTSSQAICSIYHCKNCRLKFRNLSELVQHQRFTHNLDLKTTFDLYNYDFDQVESVEQPPPTLQNQKEKMLNTSPIGYLRCDPYAFIMNLYWDSNEMIKCLKCDNELLRKIYKKHVDECGLVIEEEEEEAAVVDEKEVQHEITISIHDAEDDDTTTIDSKTEIQNDDLLINILPSTTTITAIQQQQTQSLNNIEIKSEPSSSSSSIEESFGASTIEDNNNKNEIIIKQQQAPTQPPPPPTHQHETRSRKRSSRLIEESSIIMTNKRQIKSSYASEHFVFFDGTNSSYRKSIQNTLQNDYYEVNQQKSRQITATVASSKQQKTKSTTAAAVAASIEQDLSINNDDLNNLDTTATSTTSSAAKPTLLINALNSCGTDKKKKILLNGKRGKYQTKKSLQSTNSEQPDEEQVLHEIRTSRRIRIIKTNFKDNDEEIENELESTTTTDNRQNGSNLSQIVATATSADPSISKQSADASSSSTSFAVDCESNNENDSLKNSHFNKSQQQFKCEKCGLEFTSANSVTRHQDKSCLRIHILNLDNNTIKCPICGQLYPSTHHISIHISKYHGSLLGSSTMPPSEEAKKMYEQHVVVVKVPLKRGRKKKITNTSAEVELDLTTPVPSPVKIEPIMKLTRKYTKRSNSLNTSNSGESRLDKRRRLNKRNSLAASTAAATATETESNAATDSETHESRRIKKPTAFSPTIHFKKRKYRFKNRNNKSLVEPEAVAQPHQKRKYVRKTLDNSEIPAGYKKKQYKCDYCDAVFKRRSKRSGHLEICKNRPTNGDEDKKSSENSNDDAVTLEKLFNEGMSNNNDSDEKQPEYKSNLHEDECIIHDDDDDDDENNVIYNNI